MMRGAQWAGEWFKYFVEFVNSSAKWKSLLISARSLPGADVIRRRLSRSLAKFSVCAYHDMQIFRKHQRRKAQTRQWHARSLRATVRVRVRLCSAFSSARSSRPRFGGPFNFDSFCYSQHFICTFRFTVFVTCRHLIFLSPLPPAPPARTPSKLPLPMSLALPSLLFALIKS